MQLMTKSELNVFRRVLENRQAELGSTRKNREALAIETSPDELDRIQHASERDMAIGNLERDSSRLLEVRAALRRIESRTFGVCIHCEENITRSAWPPFRGLRFVSPARKLPIARRRPGTSSKPRSSWRPETRFRLVQSIESQKSPLCSARSGGSFW